MHALRRYYREIWALDMEFTALAGERPTNLAIITVTPVRK